MTGHYDLAEGQALIIEVPVLERVLYWGWTLYNPWPETLDYTNRQISLNSSQAAIDEDGKLRFVLSHSDPGVANWLDITGHPKGFLTWRVTSEKEPAQLNGCFNPRVSSVSVIFGYKRWGHIKTNDFFSPPTNSHHQDCLRKQRVN